MTAPTFHRDGAVVTVTFHGPCEDSEVRWMLDELETLLEQAAMRPVFVFDVTDGVVSPPSQRKMMGTWLNEHVDLVEKRCRGAAYVLPNAGLRGLLTAILWFAKHPVPHHVASRVAEAQVWAQKMVTGEQPSSSPPR